MTHTPIIVVLDACVLYPASIRDLLMWLGVGRSPVQVKWTDQIHNEWTRNLLQNRPDLSRERLFKTVEAMNKALPDATITDYQDIIHTLNLPDDDDRHVLAAAIRCGAHKIITLNLSDFPQNILAQYSIQAQHPDEFIAELLSVEDHVIIEVAAKQRANLKNPPMSAEHYIDMLHRNGMVKTSIRLTNNKHLI